MAVPKKRTSKAKRNMRRSHHGRSTIKLVPCAKCKTEIPSHMACPNCGTYKGREVIDTLKKINRQEKKQKEQA